MHRAQPERVARGGVGSGACQQVAREGGAMQIPEHDRVARRGQQTVPGQGDRARPHARAAPQPARQLERGVRFRASFVVGGIGVGPLHQRLGGRSGLDARKRRAAHDDRQRSGGGRTARAERESQRRER